eukprot:TRINITY_DN4907_c0_g1_i1.p1 TRINITY_DN4907_c0_g1~~TRINITY_DN4907_c0_g1_i1.p1  ORF type:complete len:659 (-),score=92.88 TRINITY_DN4907_c0_g1_i1:944-2920(-)
MVLFRGGFLRTLALSAACAATARNPLSCEDNLMQRTAIQHRFGAPFQSKATSFDNGKVSTSCGDAAEDFAAFDKDSDGFVTSEEADIPQEDWINTIRIADIDNDTLISRSEYLAYVDMMTAAQDDDDQPSGVDSDMALNEQFASLLEVGTSLFSSLDKNHDGLVDKDEAARLGDISGWENSLQKFDEDDDSKLSRAELNALLLEMKDKQGEQAAQLSEAAAQAESDDSEEDEDDYNDDAEGEQALSEIAMKALREKTFAADANLAKSFLNDTLAQRTTDLYKLFKRADADDNGEVSLDEYAASASPSRHAVLAGPFKMVVDLDKDGWVSPAESRNATAMEFLLLDADRSGQLSSEELHGAFARKGWLELRPFRAALHAAPSARLAGIVTSLLETSWDSEPPPMCSFSSLSVTGGQHTNSSDALPDMALMSTTAGRRRAMSKELAQATAEFVGGQAIAAVSEILSQDFCWRKAYDRGVGKPAGCGPGYEQRGQMCYPKCPAGYFRSDGDIEFCQKPCPEGTTDIGLHCRTNGMTKSKTCCGHCWPNNWCCRTWCCGGCGPGWTNTGCFCEPSWIPQDRKYSPGSTKYTRSVIGCTDPNFPDGPKQTPLGHFCYPKPWDGYGCDLTACRENCPALLTSCGIGACSASKMSCLFQHRRHGY